MVAQQGSRAAQPPPLNLPGRLPGHVTHLAPHAGPRITRWPDASQATTSGALHDNTSAHESSITAGLLSRSAGDGPCAALPAIRRDSARDVLALLRHLGIEEAVLGGMSQGGFLSLRAAMLAPKPLAVKSVWAR